VQSSQGTTHRTGGSARTLFGRDRADEDLDFVHGRNAIEPKATQTTTLLAHLAQTDPSVNPAQLVEAVRGTFLKLEACWQSRDYMPMQPLLTPDLFKSHLAQLEAMVRQHEINHIDGIAVQNIDLVNVRYTTRPEQREFTALITASARDYYTDDRNGSFIRGDRSVARFQEFWIFHFVNGHWLLREIEQSRESDALRNKNHVEAMTDEQVLQIAGAAGAPVDGPWSKPRTVDRSSRVLAQLDELARRDPMWERADMMSKARDTFLAILLAEETGDMTHINAANLTPAAYANLVAAMDQRRTRGQTIEYRNLCVRKVDIVWLRVMPDKANCEFMARISAHAQIAIYKSGTLVSRDDCEMPFVKYLDFSHDGRQWKMQSFLSETQAMKLSDTT
jgi:predicted lipid-binding transport protein (Tim44 family)